MATNITVANTELKGISQMQIHKTLLLLFMLTHLAEPAMAVVSFDWAHVGNPGNEPDSFWWRVLGRVDYVYCISKYEVTNAQYTEFLNAVASTDTYGLFSDSMASTTRGGILRFGEPGSYSYSVKPDVAGADRDGATYTYAQKPVIYVSFLDAMRFANWLQNGQPTGAQNSTTTEEGTYTIVDGLTEARSTSANYFLPSIDEWHKAAFHKNDGVTGNYWQYAMASDSTPKNNIVSKDDGNSTNVAHIQSAWLATGNESYPLTDVGSYKLSESAYGTFDQGGNVTEFLDDTGASPYSRISFGNEWSSSPWPRMVWANNPSTEFWNMGFRIASIPEPSALTLAITFATILLVARRERN